MVAENDNITQNKSKPLRPKLAASLILTRTGKSTGTEILFGKRSVKHAFMPQKYVFPGGRVDRTDSYAPLAREPKPETMAILCKAIPPARARATIAAAIRETAEETGLLIGVKGAGITHKKQWKMFCDAGSLPDGEPLKPIAHAVTPPGRTRRFDTWFFTVDAKHLCGSDELRTNGELEDLKWVPLDKAKTLDIPIVTHFVLDELNRHLSGQADGVHSLKVLRSGPKVDVL